MTVGTLAPNEKDLYKIVNIVRQLAEGRNNAPEMSGDATQNAAGVVTIAGDAVTNAKLANMMQASAKGRAVGVGTGDPIDLSPAQLFEIVAAGSTKPTVRKFTSSTIYTPSSAAVTWCLCMVKAGGGSGGGSSAAPPVGGGGGEGGVAWKVVPVAAISGQSITVGAGGASIPAGTSSEGSTGGTSSIGAVVTATGGIGGTRGQFGGAGGLGGTVGAADWGMPGCCGACGSDSNGTFGFNSNGGGNGAGNLTAAGKANSGGGGGGGTAGSASGPGGSGIVVIIEFYD
jgi:hypothetical protein